MSANRQLFLHTRYCFQKLRNTNSGDHMEHSLWEEGCILPSFPQLEGNIKTDILIIGGGMAGILCAHALAADGVDYLLIEAGRIGSGVTRNTTAKITSQHGLIYGRLTKQFGPETARMYWEANEAALREYRGLSQSIDCDFERKDNYIYRMDSKKPLETELSALDQLRIPAEFAKPHYLPMRTAGAVVFRDQAQFHPLKFLTAICRDLNIREHTKAMEFVGNTVITNTGTITAEKIIIATHFPMLNKHGGYFLKMYQQRSYVLALENAGNVQGMYLDEGENGLSFRNTGDILLLGGGGHRTGKPGTGWAGLEAFAQRHFPEARQICCWATQDCITLDGIPYIGQYGKHTPNLYVVTGFHKWGMTSSMVSALLLRDLVQGRENPYARVFSPNRTMLRPQLLVNTLESTANLLTPTKPRCPHLGCALKWNPQEHSWDCPCHGSRFSKTGERLNGPATGDLKRKNTDH